MSSLKLNTNGPAFWKPSESVKPEREDHIAGERRNDRRYELQLELRWKLIRRRKVLCEGVGHTLDLSSGGMLLEVGRNLPVGLNLELSVIWPVLLHDVAPLQLAVSGRIVRSQGTLVAMRTVQHEFRTFGNSGQLPASDTASARTPLTIVKRIQDTPGYENVAYNEISTYALTM
jgi:hypothetical protein